MRNATITIETARAILAELLAVENIEPCTHAEAFQDWCDRFSESRGTWPDEAWTDDELIDAYLSDARGRHGIELLPIGVTEKGDWGIAYNWHFEVDAMTFVKSVIYDLTPKELFGEDIFESNND